MRNLFVEYDLNKPGQNYPRVHEAIKNLGVWVKIHPSFWHVRSSLTATQAAALVWRAMDPSDSLIVVDASNDDFSGYNLNPEVVKALQTQWRKAA
jgi:hypothetical protein